MVVGELSKLCFCLCVIKKHYLFVFYYPQSHVKYFVFELFSDLDILLFEGREFQ